jgi:B12-binding domain/radical SAM domain protein
MVDYDVILIHSPSIYDFRKKAVFPGPVAYTVGGSTEQFITPPVGMLSIADYLTRHGYSAIVDNLGARMVRSDSLIVEEYLGSLSARVFGIGLHWCVHSQGAMEIARLIKKLHPGSKVVMGGLTATVFAEEIVRKYDFIDGVIRGEGEKPFVRYMQALDSGEDLASVPNLTFRREDGSVCSVDLMEPDPDLDEYEFTRLDLIQPPMSSFTPGILPSWTIPVCRGCVENCASCGGSAYSYKKYLGRRKPAFRSPEKIVADLRKLTEQGVELVFLFQDPRIGGRKYWRALLKALQEMEVPLRQLTMELFGPADEEFIRELSRISVPVALTISPESGVDHVRQSHGRSYTNEELYRTMDLCKKYGIKLGSFTMAALAEDTTQTIRETWDTWEQICLLNVNERAPVDYAFGPMLLLDPGSLAFDQPEKYGYRLVFKTLEDYIAGMNLPSWHQWISYETRNLTRDDIIQLTIDSLEYSINLRERVGFYNHDDASIARFCFVESAKETVKVVNEAMELPQKERDTLLKRYNQFVEMKLGSLLFMNYQREQAEAQRRARSAAPTVEFK